MMKIEPKPYCNSLNIKQFKNNKMGSFPYFVIKKNDKASEILTNQNYLPRPQYTQEEKYRKIMQKCIIGVVAFTAAACALIFSLKTGYGQKEMNKLFNWVDTSQNIIAKGYRKVFSKGNLNIEISDKAKNHVLTEIDNVDGLGRNGVSGAHELSAFIKSFYKSGLKDNIKIKSIKMKNKKVKDGNIVIEYIEDDITKTLNACIGEGLTKGQQKLFTNLANLKANNGLEIQNFTKTKFYKTYLMENQSVKNSGKNFRDIYETLFCEKPTGKIVSIQKDNFIDGIYNIKYQKLTGGSFEKTIFINKQINSKDFKKFKELCSPSISKNIIKEIKDGKKLYNIENVIEIAKIALRRGVIKKTNKNETIILGQGAGTIFCAYCDKTKNGSYNVKSFFPVLHGSEKHREVMLDYYKAKDKLSILDIPKLMGLQINTKLYDNFLRSVRIIDSWVVCATSGISTLYVQHKKDKAN